MTNKVVTLVFCFTSLIIRAQAPSIELIQVPSLSDPRVYDFLEVYLNTDESINNDSTVLIFDSEGVHKKDNGDVVYGFSICDSIRNKIEHLDKKGYQIAGIGSGSYLIDVLYKNSPENYEYVDNFATESTGFSLEYLIKFTKLDDYPLVQDSLLKYCFNSELMIRLVKSKLIRKGRVSDLLSIIQEFGDNQFKYILISENWGGGDIDKVVRITCLVANELEPFDKISKQRKNKLPAINEADFKSITYDSLPKKLWISEQAILEVIYYPQVKWYYYTRSIPCTIF